jgi:hypothetical protein
MKRFSEFIGDPGKPTMAEFNAFSGRLLAHQEAVRLNASALKKAMPSNPALDSLFGHLIMAHDGSKTLEPELTAYTLKMAWDRTRDPGARARVLGIYEAGKRHHFETNGHHPEHWRPKGGVQLMPTVFLAEMACDIGSFQRQWPDEKDALRWWKSQQPKRWPDFKKDQVSTVTEFLEIISADIAQRDREALW